MLNLTFGEQVKLILSRKGMTIKELAENIEEKTGKRMSRQNLTQKLGRDNFQEQDMRMIAGILGCTFQLSILGEIEESGKELSTGNEKPGERKSSGEAIAEEQKRQKNAGKDIVSPDAVKETMQSSSSSAPKAAAAERDITIGELVDIHEELDEMMRRETGKLPALDESEEMEETENRADIDEVLREMELLEQESAHREKSNDAGDLSAGAGERKSHGLFSVLQRYTKKNRDGKEPEIRAEEPVVEIEDDYIDYGDAYDAGGTEDLLEEAAEEKRRACAEAGDEAEDLERGDVNPYTGHEYETNSVRTHPKRIGYVQVYDRSDHQWTDMTEWAFLGYQERKKALLGKDYDPPIYLD